MANLMDTIHYQYRLNENARSFFNLKKEPLSIQIHGVTIYSEESGYAGEGWKTSRYKIPELLRYTRSVKNPGGPVDCQEYIPSQKRIINNEVRAVENSGLIPDHIYEHKDLLLKTREELIEVAIDLGISVTRKKPERLIKEILIEQNKLESKLEKDNAEDYASMLDTLKEKEEEEIVLDEKVSEELVDEEDEEEVLYSSQKVLTEKENKSEEFFIAPSNFEK